MSRQTAANIHRGEGLEGHKTDMDGAKQPKAMFKAETQGIF